MSAERETNSVLADPFARAEESSGMRKKRRVSFSRGKIIAHPPFSDEETIRADGLERVENARGFTTTHVSGATETMKYQQALDIKVHGQRRLQGQ